MNQDDDILDLLDDLDGLQLIDDGQAVSLQTNHSRRIIWVDDEKFGNVFSGGNGPHAGRPGRPPSRNRDEFLEGE